VFPINDFARRRTTPYVNWTLLAINIAVFVYMLTLTGDNAIIGDFVGTETEKFLFDYGFVSACLAREVGVDVTASATDLSVCPAGQREFLQVFTSMYVHAGIAHIAGNMVFLWIFGDNVEDRLGHVRYLIFYLAAGVAAAAVQTFMAVNTVVPSVGASGAIAGVLGAYLVTYPFVRVQVIIFPLFFLPFIVPAAVLIVIWFVMQLISGVGELGQATAGSGIAWWAHIGGFVAGIILLVVLRPPRGTWQHRTPPVEYQRG
jgi:membrane associated rhomboid family serine protease